MTRIVGIRVQFYCGREPELKDHRGSCLICFTLARAECRKWKPRVSANTNSRIVRVIRNDVYVNHGKFLSFRDFVGKC